MHGAANCGRALRGTTNLACRSGCASFSSVRGGNEVKDDYKKRASECECSNARCIRGKAWRLLLAFVAFVHSLDDGFGQIERGIGKKYVVSLF